MRSRALLGVVVAVVLALCVACGGKDSSGQDVPDVVFLSTGCVTAKDAELSRYQDDDVTALVGIMGSGKAGVVISYEINGSVCPWVPLAHAFVERGYSVLLYDRLDGPEGSFVAPMVKLLRDHGAEHIGLVGGSIGGMASITQAPSLDPPAEVIVSLSGASSDTTSAAGKITVPLLIIVAKGDTTFSVPAVSTNDAAKASPDHQLVVLPGNAHASLLFSVDKTVQDRVVSFVEKAMPASG